MIRWLIKQFYFKTFRRTFLIWTAAIQLAMVGLFTLVMISELNRRALDTLRESLDVSAASYARNAEFAFIVSFEEERRRLLSPAVASETNLAVFIVDPEGQQIASLSHEFIEQQADLLAGVEYNDAPAIYETNELWLFVHPVVYTGGSEGEALTDELVNGGNVLGYYGLIASKSIVNILIREITAYSIAGAMILLLLVLVANALLASFVLRPVNRLVDDTERARRSENGVRLSEKGPSEVRVLAAALNELLDANELVNEQLNEKVRQKTIEEREQRRRAEELHARAEQLLNTREALMQTNTHDLMYPLRLIMNVVERIEEDLSFLEGTGTRDKALSDLSRIRRHVEDGSKLVREVNQSLQINDVPVEMKERSLKDLHRALASTFSPETELRGNKIIYNVDAHKMVYTDHRRLETICRNLMSNACKFTYDGEVELSVQTDGAQIEIICRDTGIGIDESQQEIIFGAFQRGDMSSTRPETGLGLGLTIIKDNVERLNGEIELESAIGCGTTFTVRIPIEKDQADADLSDEGAE